MIDAFLRILDRLIELRRYKSARLQKQYEVIVKPTVADLERVHTDYLRMFIDARQQLSDGSATLAQTIEMLESRRNQFAPVRQKLLAPRPELLAVGSLPLIREFTGALVSYFPVGDLHTASGTAATTLIMELRRRQTTTREADPRDNEILSSLAPIITGIPLHVLERRYGRADTQHDDPIACIDSFIRFHETHWQFVCMAAASIQMAVAAAD